MSDAARRIGEAVLDELRSARLIVWWSGADEDERARIAQAVGARAAAEMAAIRREVREAAAADAGERIDAAARFREEPL
jgi:hypothetical protein